MRTKEEYEKLINESRLFFVDRQKDSVLFDTEKFSFVGLLFEYYSNIVFATRPLDSYSMEFMESANECVKHYDVSKGTPFLNYFNVVLKKNLLKSKAKASVEERRHGIHIARNEDRLIRRIIKYADTIGKDIKDESTLSIIADAIGIELDYLKELIQINQDAMAVSDITYNSDGEEISLFDTCASKEPSAEEKLVIHDEIEVLLKRIDGSFAALQERTKPVVRMLMTAYIIKQLGDSPSFLEYIDGLSFIEEEVIMAYQKTGSVISAREIAARFGMSEASISRIQTNFIERVRQNAKSGRN